MLDNLDAREAYQALQYSCAAHTKLLANSDALQETSRTGYKLLAWERILPGVTQGCRAHPRCHLHDGTSTISTLMCFIWPGPAFDM